MDSELAIQYFFFFRNMNLLCKMYIKYKLGYSSLKNSYWHSFVFQYCFLENHNNSKSLLLTIKRCQVLTSEHSVLSTFKQSSDLEAIKDPFYRWGSHGTCMYPYQLE
jgi:hypothetical protein